MKLNNVAKNEYLELEKVMNYINQHHSVEGKFVKIKCGNLDSSDHDHPILICEGDAFLKIKNINYPLELAKNYIGPKECMSDKGTYLCVTNLTPLDNVSRRLYEGILQDLVSKSNVANLYLDYISSRLGCHPLESKDFEKQVDEFFSQTESIIGLVNSSEVVEKIRDLGALLSFGKADQ